VSGLSPNPGGNGAALAQIELQDNGPGFTPEALTKASTPFWTTKVVGLGLGLAVAKRILEVHHGRIDLEPPSAKKGRAGAYLPAAEP
jgi:C4-dicarboxylate-specific signal transduction histidine kinase